MIRGPWVIFLDRCVAKNFGRVHFFFQDVERKYPSKSSLDLICVCKAYPEWVQRGSFSFRRKSSLSSAFLSFINFLLAKDRRSVGVIRGKGRFGVSRYTCPKFQVIPTRANIGITNGFPLRGCSF